jgi:oxygen-independent coproporphyrinogen-3 oxidase
MEMANGARAAETLGIYLSIPFCRSKCTFCNFASGVYPASELLRYVARVIGDLGSARGEAERAGLLLPRRVDTVYFGGGTPSLLSAGQLGAIFASLRENFELEPDAEITLEAAPAFLADDLRAAAVELGVTRVSFGVQSFVDAEARATGRLHTADQALADIARARRAGLAVSVDLIAGLPGQTKVTWQHSLETLVACEPGHASIYMLEVDEDSRLGGEMLLGGTRYGAGLTPSDDTVAELYAEACAVFDGHGLRQYEISNFARAGCESRHNLRYWLRRPYLGVGLDAHSMLRTLSGQPSSGRASAGRTVRFGTADSLGEYLDAPGGAVTGELHRLNPEEELEEAWFLGLRRNIGVSLGEMRAEFGQVALERAQPVLAQLAEDGLICRTERGDRVALTERGRMLSNEVFANFLGLEQTRLDRAESTALAAATR